MSQFKEYATATAFQISLSKRMIEMLLYMERDGNIHGLLPLCGHWFTTAGSLVRRGLAYHQEGKGYQATEAGLAIVPLLKLAGFSIQQTEEKCQNEN